jgi:Cu+-exporting ATPase
MSLSQLLVTAAGVFLVAFLARFFFRARPGATAEVTTAGQEATVVVLGGYQPGVVRARTGLPLRLAFDRREDGECSSRVVFRELGVNRFLAPFTSTTIELGADRPGVFEFACGMNMIHGTLVIEGEPAASAEPARAQGAGAGGDVVDLDVEATAHRAELADLARRVVVGAVLTLPVFVAVMAMEVLDATWLPDVLLEPWVQLAMITPVMVWVGWPIHEHVGELGVGDVADRAHDFFGVPPGRGSHRGGSALLWCP